MLRLKTPRYRWLFSLNMEDLGRLLPPPLPGRSSKNISISNLHFPQRRLKKKAIWNMQIDRRLFIHFDWVLLGIVLVIASIGILNLYSATAMIEMAGIPYYLKQIFWLLIGLVLMVTIVFVEYRFFSDFAYI